MILRPNRNLREAQTSRPKYATCRIIKVYNSLEANYHHRQTWSVFSSFICLVARLTESLLCSALSPDQP